MYTFEPTGAHGTAPVAQTWLCVDIPELCGACLRSASRSDMVCSRDLRHAHGTTRFVASAPPPAHLAIHQYIKKSTVNYLYIKPIYIMSPFGRRTHNIIRQGRYIPSKDAFYVSSFLLPGKRILRC